MIRFVVPTDRGQEVVLSIECTNVVVVVVVVIVVAVVAVVVQWPVAINSLQKT